MISQFWLRCYLKRVQGENNELSLLFPVEWQFVFEELRLIKRDSFSLNVVLHQNIMYLNAFDVDAYLDIVNRGIGCCQKGFPSRHSESTTLVPVTHNNRSQVIKYSALDSRELLQKWAKFAWAHGEPLFRNRVKTKTFKNTKNIKEIMEKILMRYEKRNVHTIEANFKKNFDEDKSKFWIL